VTKEVYYKKVGRKYVAVSEYDSDLCSAFPRGKHLIISMDPGITSYHYNIDPAFAPVLAAAKYGEDTLSKSIMKASEIRRREREGRKLTEEQRKAWEHLVDVFGDEAKQLEWPSARGAAEEVMQKLAEEADKMLKIPAVRNAFEQFMLVYKLTKDDENDTES
jgi:hypothetical protein